MQLFFFDTETTGLSPENDRIIQFGAIYGLYDKKTDIFHEERRINQYIKTDVPSNEKALAVHQITPEFLEPFFEMEYYIKEFLAYMNKSDVVIGHNLSYDMSMLKGEAERCKVAFDFRSLKTFCTMKQTSNVEGLHVGGKYPKLAELYRFIFNEDFDNAHNAMADIEATQKCFCELYKTNKIIVF